MSNYTNLKNAIQSVIKANGNNEITGPILQSELLSMIITLGAGYQYMGVAQPSTNPGTPDARVMYLAYLPGTYVNFGGLTVTGFCVLKYDTVWSKEDIPISGGGGSAGFLTEPDDLTLETVGNTQVLKFANRQYNNNTPNGLGYKILRGDSTFAEQVTEANTIYEIRYDFNLSGGEFAMPSGCELRFVGGKIAGNGTLIGTNTKLIAPPSFIFDGVLLSGSFVADVALPEWFGAVGDGVADDTLAIQKCATLFSNIVLNGSYSLTSVEVPEYHSVKLNGVVSSNGDGFVLLTGATINGGKIIISQGKTGITLGNSANENFRRIVVSDVYLQGGEYGIYAKPTDFNYCTFCIFAGVRLYHCNHGIFGSIRTSIFTISSEQCIDNINISGQLNIIDLVGQAGNYSSEYPYFITIDGHDNIINANVFDLGSTNGQKYLIFATGGNTVNGTDIRNPLALISGGNKTKHLDGFLVPSPYYTTSIVNGTINYPANSYSVFNGGGLTTFFHIKKTDPGQDMIYTMSFGAVRYPVGIDLWFIFNYTFDKVEIYDDNTLLQRMTGNNALFSFGLTGKDVYTDLKVVCTKSGTGNVRMKGCQFWCAMPSSKNNKSGTTANRPPIGGWMAIGTQYFDTTLGKPIFYTGQGWVDAGGNTPLAKVGTSANRPSASAAGAGFTYFDTDLGKMIVSNGTDWVNMDGTGLS